MLHLFALFLLSACAGSSSRDHDRDGGDPWETTPDSGTTNSGTTDDTGSTTGGTTTWTGNCPSDVPAEYRDSWDCQASTCGDGGVMLYHAGVGASDAGMSLDVLETWYLFWQEGGSPTHCTDSLQISGEESSYSPDTFECDSCELIFDVSWTVQSDNGCGIPWGSLFIDDPGDTSGPFQGVIMLDTHTAFGDRNADDAVIVYGAAFDESYYYKDNDYGRGTATPTSAADGPPEDYSWASSGGCLN